MFIFGFASSRQTSDDPQALSEEDELLEEEFDKFISIYPPEEDVNLRALKYFFKAYIVDQDIRKIISSKDFHALQTHPMLTISQFKEVQQNTVK